MHTGDNDTIPGSNPIATGSREPVWTRLPDEPPFAGEGYATLDNPVRPLPQEDRRDHHVDVQYRRPLPRLS